MPTLEQPKPLACSHRSSKNTRNRARITARGYRTFYCSACARLFNEKTGSALNCLHYPQEVVLLVVMWRLRYGLSLRDLTEMFLARGITFTHETVRLWEARFAPLSTAKLKAERKEHLKKKPNLRWKTDETYLKVGKKQVYLYRAIDEFGNLVDVRLCESRDLAARPKGTRPFSGKQWRLPGGNRTK